MSYKKLTGFDPNNQATSENLLEFIQTLTTMANKDGSGWKNLRFEMVSFSNDILEAWHGERKPILRDLAPRIWDFYCGYMACHKNWASELEQVGEELEGEPLTCSD